MKKLRELLPENKIVVTAHYLDNTKTRFHTHAKDDNELHTKIKQLHHFVRYEKKPMNWLATYPDGTFKSGKLHEISDNAKAAIKRMADDPRTHPNVRAIAQDHLNNFKDEMSDKKADFHKAFDDLASKSQGWKNSRKPKAASDLESFKRYNSKVKDYHYTYKGSLPDTSGSPEEDHTVHHYTHMKGHKVELHMDPEQNHVDHWYHINDKHKATKGKGFNDLHHHLNSEYIKMWS